MDPQAPNVPTITPEASSTEIPSPQQQKDKHGITILAMAVFVLLSLGAVAFLYQQNQQLKGILAGYQINPTPTSSATALATADPTANWKTYANTNAQIAFKYPVQMTEMLATEGGVSGPILGNANLVVSYADKTTVLPGDSPFDGFSIYDIETAKLGMSFDAYITKEVNAVKSSPRGISTASAVKVSMGSQNYTYIDSETNIRRYFVSSPDNKRIAIFSRINSTIGFLNIFDQILSTFKFTSASPSAVPSNTPVSTSSALPLMY